MAFGSLGDGDAQRGPKDLYSEGVESISLIGAVIAKAEVRRMQRRMRNDHRRRALAGDRPPEEPPLRMERGPDDTAP